MRRIGPSSPAEFAVPGQLLSKFPSSGEIGQQRLGTVQGYHCICPAINGLFRLGRNSQRQQIGFCPAKTYNFCLVCEKQTSDEILIPNKSSFFPSSRLRLTLLPHPTQFQALIKIYDYESSTFSKMFYIPPHGGVAWGHSAQW